MKMLNIYASRKKSVTTFLPCFDNYQHFLFWFPLSPQLFFMRNLRQILDAVSFHSLIPQDPSLKDKYFWKNVTAKLWSHPTKLTIILYCHLMSGSCLFFLQLSQKCLFEIIFIFKVRSIVAFD